MEKALTADDIRSEIDGEFARWNDLLRHGGSDPQWTDGDNLNNIRNHIIYWMRMLRDLVGTPAQMSLFGDAEALPDERPLPPEDPNSFMVKNGAYADVRTERFRGRGETITFDTNWIRK